MVVKAIGKSLSYLLYKAPKGKINPNSLGYICPDKTINFATAETANTYAKNVVMQALNCPNPYEKSVIVNGKRILYEQNGSHSQCLVSTNTDGIWVHGHPDFWGKGKTTPFSALDYNAFMISKSNNALIYNSIGQKSQLTKKETSSFWDKLMLKLIPKDKYNAIKTQSRITVCSSGYNNALLKNCSGSIKLKLNKLAIRRFIAMVKKDVPNFEKYTKEYTDLYNQELEKALQDEKVAERLHSFWIKNAKRFGVEYSSNFGNFA